MPKLKKLRRPIKPLRSRYEEPQDEEDLEIKRLERLLKIDGKKGRKEAAAKLNREFEEFEGIGGGLGDFLMELDVLTQDIKSKRLLKTSSDDQNIDEDEDEVNKEVDDDDGAIESNEDEDEDHDDGDGDDGDGDGDDGDGDGDDGDEDEDETHALSSDVLDSTSTYQPVAGEDIYGRIIDPEAHTAANTMKYIPPSKRKLAEVDNTSESVSTLRRSMNGLLNRLGDQSKDSIARSLKTLFDSNSLNLSNSLLKECTLTVCAKSDQTMVTLIPIYTAVISVLHNTVSKDVGAYLIEHLVTLFVDGLTNGSSPPTDNESLSSIASDHKFIISKTLMNYLLILIYFYNLKVLHHQLILDLMKLIGDTISSEHVSMDLGMIEARLELITCVIEHCGFNLRRDDPTIYKDTLLKIIQHVKNISLLPIAATTTTTTTTATARAEKSTESSAGTDTNESESRVHYLLAILQDSSETNSKSQRVANKHAEAVKSLRKWIGGMKSALMSSKRNISSHGAPTGDTCLHVSLRDLQDADKRGRWWRAGASWKGNDTNTIANASSNTMSLNSNSSTTDALWRNESLPTSKNRKVTPTIEPSAEEEALLKLAKKLRFNTTTRRNVFMIVMSSRDVSDAFERLVRLEMKGKEDREIIRVLLECCAQESKYNAFYAELNVTLCNFNRQFKTTSQYAIWDFFKTLEENKEIPTRRVVNLARYLSHLLCSFDVPMAILKRVDISSLSDNMILFLRTLFLALFSAQIEEDSFEKIFDRIATSNDCLAVRDTITYFLQTYMKSAPTVEVPVGMDPSTPRKRQKLVLRLLMSMDVLSVAKAQSEQA